MSEKSDKPEGRKTNKRLANKKKGSTAKTKPQDSPLKNRKGTEIKSQPQHSTPKNKKGAEVKSKPQHFPPKKKKGDPLPSFSDEVRLNKFIANAGICSRREADVLISSGVVVVNGKIITQMGFKVKPGDEVKYDGALIKTEKKQYVLLNKPKNFITTMDDPQGRKTAFQLVANACKERIYPVGRLDRNTTGLLLFTNDGDMAKRLTHPRYEISKLYHVTLSKPIKKEQLDTLCSGLELDDGAFVKADKVELIHDSGNREAGIELHSGKNRVVRRMFEAIGFEVTKLDRVKFASLTKKDLPRGNYRHLTEKEVSFLKMT
jgi:23S rRNA pseudouridine2605 synthase